MNRHLVVAVSYHGFGHVAQTAAVVNALRQRIPSLKLTLQTSAPHAVVKRRFTGSFEHVPEAVDVGMLMKSALETLSEESAAAYRAFHRDWDTKVAQEAEKLRALKPDLILANVPYLTLAAAARAHVPALAYCSLNWADIFMHYCGGRRDSATIEQQMLEAYTAAQCFIQPAPSMPMENLENTREVGPVARLGNNVRERINRQLGIDQNNRLVLVAPGGFALPIDFDHWPRFRNIRWLVQSDWGIRHPDMVPIESLDLDYLDILTSCDALITKPGYGTVTEAACNGVPVLYIRRFDWPEEPYLIDWLQQHGRCLEISNAALVKGDLADALETVLSQKPPAPPRPAGIQQVTDIIESFLR